MRFRGAKNVFGSRGEQYLQRKALTAALTEWPARLPLHRWCWTKRRCSILPSIRIFQRRGLGRMLLEHLIDELEKHLMGL